MAKLQVGNKKSVKNRSRSGQTVMALLFTEVYYYSRINIYLSKNFIDLKLTWTAATGCGQLETTADLKKKI